MVGPLEGKVAVVTGGTSGIGARTAELFVAEGARVVIAGRRREKGKQVAAALGAAASFIRTDVSVETEVRAMIEHAVEKFGRLDCLVNNAGTGSRHVEIANVDLEEFDAAIGVHLRGVLAGMKYAARNGRARIRQHHQCCQHQWRARRVGRTLLFSSKGRFHSFDPLRRRRTGREGGTGE
jgi:NAD(P)-dependent dehydrogenase (short-subunit alcohol dehydrogenase family)